MKKVLFLSILSIYICSACKRNLDLDPISSATTTTFYNTTHDFLQGLSAVYNSLHNYPDRQLNLSETRSDNLYAVTTGNRDWGGINAFQKTIANNPYVSDAWEDDFNGIYKANSFLDELKKNGGVISDPALATRMEGEAKFLRAFYYFDLLKLYGKLPLVDHPVTATEALSIPRSPVNDIYGLIISDLTFSANNLPEVYGDADRGRVTKYAAKGILAEVHMTRSGPTYGIEGPGLGLNEWDLALPLLNDIIGSMKYQFLPSYSSIFSYTNEDNPEVVFGVQYISGQNPILGASFPAVLTPDTYFRSLGAADQNALSIRQVSNDLLNAYEVGDIRMSFSIQNGYNYNGAQETRSFFKKYLDINKIPVVADDWSINFIALRYTDILMLKAECILHGAPGTVGEVNDIINQVRHRAGLGDVSNVTLTQLLDERRKEFAGEGLRWPDLVRFGVVESVMQSWITAEDVQHQINLFQKNYIIYPVPQAQLDIKPGFYEQNQGY